MKDKKWIKVTYQVPDENGVFNTPITTATTWVPLGVSDENVSEYLVETLDIRVIEWSHNV